MKNKPIDLNLLNKSAPVIEKEIQKIESPDEIRALIESEQLNKNRKTVFESLASRYQYLMLKEKGFNTDLLTFLLNEPPFFDKNKEKEEFTEKRKKEILQRDNYTCQLCYSMTRRLSVHHINPQGSADPDNLITLCNGCHNAVHRILRNKGYPYYYQG